jgi:hypothetical protein
MGAARLGKTASARDAEQQLAVIHQRLARGNEPYWALQVEIQRTDVLGWTALAEHDSNSALSTMHQAVELENGTEKSVVTPEPIQPTYQPGGSTSHWFSKGSYRPCSGKCS